LDFFSPSSLKPLQDKRLSDPFFSDFFSAPIPGTQKSHAFFGAFLREISLKTRLTFRENLPRFHSADIAKT
jgi:hypothetical protein